MSEAILNIVKAIREILPNAFIIVLSIPPKGRINNNYREKVYAINERVEKLMMSEANSSPLNIYLDCNKFHDFVNKVDGTISKLDMYDYLHFTDQGYDKFCQPIINEIKRVLSIG